MGNHGIKITLDGYDVSTASDEQLAFSSKYKLSKIQLQGTVTVTGTPSNYVTSSITHGLGYRPAFLCWVRDPYITNDPTRHAMEGTSRAYIDDDKIYFKVYWNGGSNQNFVFYYYVLVGDAQ